VVTSVPSGTAKGAIVRPMVEWLAATHGQAAVAVIATELDPRWLAYLRADAPALGIVHARWYDEELASALAERILAYVAGAGGDRDEALARIGEVTVERSLGRFARAALWFASPEMTALSAQMFWRFYHSRGTISATVQGTTMTAVGTGWSRHGRDWCSVVGASAVHVLELARCIAPRLDRHVCGGGAAPCEMTLRWSR
jgi:hypothetical protein